MSFSGSHSNSNRNLSSASVFGSPRPSGFSLRLHPLRRDKGKGRGREELVDPDFPFAPTPPLRGEGGVSERKGAEVGKRGGKVLADLSETL